MQKNMARWDRIGRVILAIVFILLAIKHGGLLFDLLGLIGLVFLVTAAIGFCPLYTVLGFKTGE